MTELTNKPQRLVSLDAFRGLVMCTLAINGLGIAATAKKLGYGPGADVTTSSGQILQWLAFHNSHPTWNSQFYVVGCSCWDLIQPAFMFMVGVAMPYSYASRKQRGDSQLKLTAHAFVRAVVLVLIGVYLQTRNSGLETNRLFTNVLAQIGLGYFFVYLLLERSVRIQLMVAAVVLAGYSIWISSYNFIGPFTQAAQESIVSLSVPTSLARDYALTINAPAAADVMLLNSLVGADEPIAAHAAGYTTFNFIPSAITMLLGVLVGALLRSDRDEYAKLKRLAIAGAMLMTLALLASYTFCPIIKKIWTPAWVLYSGAWMLWSSAALYWLIDVRGYKRWTFPLVVVGMNSLAMYLMSMLFKAPITSQLKTYLGKSVFSGPYGPMLQAIAVFVVLWLICYYLYRNRLFLRV